MTRSKLLAAVLLAALAAPAFAETTDPSRLTPRAVAVDRGEHLASTAYADERRDRRAPMATVALNALYGGGAGALIGIGVALIEQDNYGRDVMVGTGIGVIAGAIVGGVMAYGDSGPDRLAVDGLGTPARDARRQRPMTRLAAYTLRW